MSHGPSQISRERFVCLAVAQNHSAVSETQSGILISLDSGLKRAFVAAVLILGSHQESMLSQRCLQGIERIGSPYGFPQALIIDLKSGCDATDVLPKKCGLAPGTSTEAQTGQGGNIASQDFRQIVIGKNLVFSYCARA